MAKATPLASEDVTIESIEQSSVASGAFDLVVDIAGEEIGEGAKLAEVLGVEGAAELNESAFSSEGLTVTLQRTADGKAKATVTPKRNAAHVLSAREGEVAARRRRKSVRPTRTTPPAVPHLSGISLARSQSHIREGSGQMSQR